MAFLRLSSWTPKGHLQPLTDHAAINADTKGEDMPRKSKTFSKIFADANLLGLNGTHQRGSDLAGQVVGCISVRINVLYVAVSHLSGQLVHFKSEGQKP